MAVDYMTWNWGWAYGGDPGESVSMQVNFAPGTAVAQASLTGADGDGLCMGGITQYRYRADPAGPDQEQDFGWNSNFGYPPIATASLMTSATAQLEVGGNGQQGVMSLMVWVWD